MELKYKKIFTEFCQNINNVKGVIIDIPPEYLTEKSHLKLLE